MGWLNINGNWIGRHSGKSWSSYWATRTPSDPVLYANSETEIAGHFKINGSGQDGHKVYYSDDNVIFSLLTTLTGVTNFFAATGLTTATKYYFNIVAYKGANESDRVSADAVTLNSSMIAGWDFNEENEPCFANTLADTPFGSSNYSSAQYFNGKTYIGYNGASDNPYIITYTHATDTWSAPVLIGASSLPDGDDHGQPAILIDADGYIHVMWDGHNSEIKYAKSDNPEDITAWTAMTSPCPAPGGGTYPQLFQFSDDTIYLFRREVPISATWGYQTSGDGGATWSAFTQVTDDFAYAHFRKGIGDTVHCVMFGNDQTDAARKNIYYIFFNGTNWVNINGTVLSLPVQHVEDVADVIAYDSGDYYTPFAQVNFDSTNKPIIIFPKSVTELDLTDFDTKILKHDGATWNDYNIVHSGGFLSSYRPELDIISDTVFHAYVITGIDSPYKGRLERFISNDAGATWAKDQVIHNGIAYPIALVRNYDEDAKLVFSEYKNATTYFNNSGFLWGESGYIGGVTSLTVPSIKRSLPAIKNAALSLITDAFGTGYDFNGSPDALSLLDDDNFSFDSGSPDAPFSVTFEINVESTAVAQTLVNKNVAPTIREYDIDILTNTIRIYLIHSEATNNFIIATAPFTTVNSKVFVCCTYDGSGSELGLKIFLDLIESQTSQTETGTYTGMTNSSAKINIANYRDTSGYLVGKLYSLKFWNKVLTPTEMANVKNNVAGW